MKCHKTSYPSKPAIFFIPVLAGLVKFQCTGNSTNINLHSIRRWQDGLSRPLCSILHIHLDGQYLEEDHVSFNTGQETGFATLDKRQAGRASSNMEKAGFVKGMEELEGKDMNFQSHHLK